MTTPAAAAEPWRGVCYCDGALCDGGAGAGRSALSPATVQLPAAALNALGVGAGERVLVAIVQLSEDSSSAAANNAAATPGGRGASPGGAPTPPRTPPSTARGASRPRLDLGAGATPLPFASSHAARMLDSGAASSSAAPTELPGERLLAACVWPSQKLGVGSVSASPAVLDVAAQPPSGVVLRVFPLASSSTTSEPRLAARMLACERLTLTLCGAAEAAAQSAMPDASAAAPSAPSTPATPLPPRTPRTSGSASKAATPGESPARAPAAAKARAASASAEWVARAVAEASPAPLALLGSLAARCLEGRSLLLGNCVTLPLLGHTVRCRVTAATAGDGAGYDGHAQSLCVFCVTAQTAVTLCAPSSVQPAGAALAAASSAASAAASGAGSSAQEGAESTATSAPQVAPLAAENNRTSFATLGGVEDAIAALRRLVVLPLRRPALFAAAGLRPPRGVLLHGPPGTGKTHLARAVATEAGAALFVISGPELVSEYYGESESRLRDVFAAAAAAAPAVVFLDEVDAIAPARAEGGSEGSSGGGGFSARIVTTLLTLLDGGTDALQGVAVVAATNRPEAVDGALRRPGRFDAEVAVGIPSAKGRVAILRAHLKGVQHDVDAEGVAALAAKLHGFTGADVGALVAEAALTALRRAVAAAEASAAASQPPPPPPRVLVTDLDAAARVIRPSGLRAFSVEAPPSAAWDDVAGLDAVKQALREVVEWPEAHAGDLARVGAAPPRGVLLYGPPGCAKTSLARAAAARCGRNFIAASGPDIYSLWVGESEKAVAALFARARAAAPCVLFLDELDALAPARESGTTTSSSGGGSKVADRVLAQLLTELDGGAGGAIGAGGVALLAATNRPDRVDAALLRPGRLDRLLYVPPPGDALERAAVLRVHLRAVPLAPDVDLNAVAEATPGFTGADLAALCREAALAALEEDLGACAVAARHFVSARAASAASPPVDAEVAAMYARLARGGQPAAA